MKRLSALKLLTFVALAGIASSCQGVRSFRQENVPGKGNLQGGARQLSSQASLDQDFPSDYIQGAFMAGVPIGPIDYWSMTWEQKLLRARLIAKRFTGAEITITDLRKPEHMQDIQDLGRALKQVESETGKPLLGYYNVSRPPGFFWPDEIARQPQDFRSQSLRSDGTLFTRLPPPEDDAQSYIAVTGFNLDITNPAAVNEFLRQTQIKFRANCFPAYDCTGPLHGFVVYNENKLTDLYTPFQKDAQTRPDQQDYWPVHWEEWDVLKRYENLRYGHPFSLMVDQDPYFNFLNPPKRVIPLFSKNAAKSFAAYAQAHGYSRMTKLPADRGEFNDREDAFNGEPRLKQRPGDPMGPDGWIQFVPLDDTEYWAVWEDWVYETWGGFVTRWAQAFTEAQQGNPEFRGVAYFQLPSWYSIRGNRASQSMSYKYADSAGATHESSITLGATQYSSANNPVVMGTDLEMIMKSPYFTAFIHETTNALPFGPRGASEDAREANIFDSDLHRELFFAKGFAAKSITHENKKIFGAFARYARLSGPWITASQSKTEVWDRFLHILRPDLVSSLAPQFYFTASDLAGTGISPAWATESLGDVWTAELSKLQSELIEDRHWAQYSNASLGFYWMQPAENAYGDPQSVTLAGKATQGDGQVKVRYRFEGETSWTSSPYSPLPGSDGIWLANVPLTVPKDTRLLEVEVSYTGMTKSCHGRPWDPATGRAVEINCGACTVDGCPYLLSDKDFGPPVGIGFHWIQPAELAGFGPANGLTIAGYAAGGTGQVSLKYRIRGATDWKSVGYAPSPGSDGTWYNSIPLRFPKDSAIYEIEASFLGRTIECAGSAWSSTGQATPIHCARRRAVGH